MDTVHDTLCDELTLVFSRACIDLARARLQQAEKDTVDHRAAVARCRSEIDDVLDWYAAADDHQRA